MKPDWKDAPEWARWLSQDQDGLWFWHENKPGLRRLDWCSDGYILKAPMQEGWKNSLEERPQ